MLEMCEIMKWLMLGLLGICAYQDLKKREISVLFLGVMSVLAIFAAIWCKDVSIAQRLAGGFVGALFLAISRLTKEAIGYGDSWLVCILGVYMGAREMLQVLLFASLLAALCSLFYLWKKRWKRKAAIPFVPFVAVMYLGAILL